jgi:hypothetical protein
MDKGGEGENEQGQKQAKVTPYSGSVILVDQPQL